MKHQTVAGVSGVPVPVRLSADGAAVALLDQTLLPGREEILRLESPEAVAEAIRGLKVRGAPAIGIATAYGVVLGFGPGEVGGAGAVGGVGEAGAPGDWALVRFDRLSALFRSTRPTAVNLDWALRRMRGVMEGVLAGGDASTSGVHAALMYEARAIHEEDARACRAMGAAGAAILAGHGGDPVRVLTHCNAGALATGGMGTALAPIYRHHADGGSVEVWVPETRPLLQGARLTAWELSRAGIPVTVITDSMAGAVMAAGRADLVLVGADRIAANGDVANKIGTYGLAALARAHGIPFYVAAPTSTFDLECPSGDRIPIEERSEDEVRGPGDRAAVPEGARVWNPAFDVTPRAWVNAYITETGVLSSPSEWGGKP